MQEQLCTCLTRYEPGARRELDRVRDVLLEDLQMCIRDRTWTIMETLVGGVGFLVALIISFFA